VKLTTPNGWTIKLVVTYAGLPWLIIKDNDGRVRYTKVYAWHEKRLAEQHAEVFYLIAQPPRVSSL
jgi:hypothetical protein